MASVIFSILPVFIVILMGYAMKRGGFPGDVLGLPEAVMSWVRHGAGVA